QRLFEASSPVRVIRRCLGEPYFGEGPSPPGEARRVPIGERHDGYALAGRVNEPAVAEEHADVADLRRRRARSVVAEEDQIGRAQMAAGDPARPGDLAAHLVGRPPDDRRSEPGRACIGPKLVDAPDEPGAVEAAGGANAER